MTTSFEKPIAGYDLLHPVARPAFEALGKNLIDRFNSGQIKTLFMPFETYRYPQRQLICIQNGTSKAKPFESAHQYGLAVDFVPRVTEHGVTSFTWSGDIPWGLLHEIAGHYGLSAPIAWDKAHIQHPLFEKIRHQW